LIRGVSWTAVAITTGYIGFRVAAHNGWIYVTRNARAFRRGAEPTGETEAASINFLVVGDTGKPTTERTRVVSAMRAHVKNHRCDAAVLLGDNFYENGVESVDDPRFDEDFEGLFDVKSFPMPFYVALGNHDCNGNAEAQVEYTAKNERWRMPDRSYRESIRRNGVAVDLFVTDTNLLLESNEASEDQLEWLKDSLEASDARWKIVIGHHPVLTGGRHHASPEVSSALGPILDECDVDFYLSGHDHDLQLLDSGRGWRQVVSGAGSKLRSTAWIDETLFAQACPGFTSMTLSRDTAYVSYYSSSSRLVTTSFSASTHRMAMPTS
jgi:acid phosphatase